jgi:phenylalanyl-tRNA synthetase beta chain
VSNAVDASNYVMVELGKPIHVFDAGAVSGGTIIVRPAREGETLETLDHVERDLTPETLLIADSGGPIGIAGVMGGAQSEVSEGTTAAIIESAVFDPVSIRRTAQRFSLRSEASARFEKGQESRLARVGADRTAQLLAAWAGGRVAVGVVDSNPVDDEVRRVRFRPARVNCLLGDEIAPSSMTEALARVGISTEPAGQGEGDGELVAVVPPYRRDITIEADVVEEICRLRGYENLPPKLPDTQMPGYRVDPLRFVDALRDMLAGRGLSEVVTNGLIGPIDHQRLGYGSDDRRTIRVENPVTIDHSELRRSLVPGLVGVLSRNERQRRADVAIFEIGAVHEWLDGDPRQAEMLGLLLAGDFLPASWAEKARAASVEDAKGLVETIADRFGMGRIAYLKTTEHAGVEHPGRTAAVEVVGDTRDEQRVEMGRVGEIDPRYLEAYEIRADRAAFALLDMTQLARLAQSVPQVRRIEQLPAVERDLAVVVTRDTPAAAVEDVIRRHAGAYLDRLTLFDRYQGAPLESQQVSLAYRLRYQPTTEPLGEAQIEASLEAVTAALARDVGGRIRSG